MNGDGIEDLITGHYWPGDIFIFHGKKDGSFAEMANLKDETGRNLNAGEPWAAEDEPRMESLAAAPYATDFDGDGDYDMLIGNIEGTIIRMENIGDAKNPKFSTKREKLMAGGQIIRVGGGDAGPIVADWDGDGLEDLLSGAGDGAVWYYRNVGKKNAPKYAAGIALLSANKSGYEPVAVGEQPTRPGTRTKVCVTDYNGDGRVDLLVGDYISVAKPEPKLEPSQIAERDALREQMAVIEKEFQEFWTKLEGRKPTAAEEKEMEKLGERMSEIYTSLEPLQGGQTPHGFVWLYLRKAPKVRL